MESPLDPISEGDRAAKAGDWAAAVAAWRCAIELGDTRGNQRIGWFLEESKAPGVSSRSLPWDMAALSAGLALGGTSLVLFAERLDGFDRTFLVILAWAAYVIAAIVTVRLAYAIGNRRRLTAQSLTDVELQRAQAQADALDPSSGSVVLESRDVRR
jgi:hypothetical protein